jgi:hypothetical protein
MRPWLPNNPFPALDAAPKPYYCESKKICQGRIATMALFGPAPVRSTRALPPTTGKSISACRRDDLVIATVNVTPKRPITPVRSIPAPREGACGEQK